MSAGKLADNGKQMLGVHKPSEIPDIEELFTNSVREMWFVEQRQNKLFISKVSFICLVGNIVAKYFNIYNVGKYYSFTKIRFCIFFYGLMNCYNLFLCRPKLIKYFGPKYSS